MNSPIKTPAMGEHLTSRQFALKYQIHEETIRRWLRNRRLTGIKMGRFWRIPDSEITRITKEQGL